MEAHRECLGPLIFSLKLNDLLTAVREVMSYFSMDSNIGQVVHVLGSIDGRHTHPVRLFL